MLILKLIFVAYLVGNVVLSICALKRKVRVQEVPMSVYERAVTWHQDIMNMTDADEKLVEFQRWKNFVESIPRRNSQLNVL